MEKKEITREILDACMTVHKYMGPGLLESIYEECLMQEFKLRKIEARNQVTIPLVYKGVSLARDLKLDILVVNDFILELKATEILHPVYEAQLLSYLRLTNKEIGFLVNFNVSLLKDGFHRFINKYYNHRETEKQRLAE